MLRTDAATRAIQQRDEAVNRNEHLKQESERCAPTPPPLSLSASRQAGLLTPRVVLVGSSKSRTVDISANMTRQYKAMQDDFVAKIDEKEGKILELKDALELSKRGE